ncbi:tRNA methyltransferase, has a role in tRNA modification [Ascosphaera aggregata]|nr:tRNA methyltransferase, has a role in tRNA modification [Ascosphaera aggregata]
MAASDTPHGETYEETHVHQVYQQIADHFSQTRYKPWPIVERFLQSQTPGSIGLDIGCGNGKYLPVNRDVFMVASDRSPNLIKTARQHHPHSAIIADTLSLPHPLHSFDFAISIAVIHHLSTPARRVAAISSILSILRDDGKALIYVWALEQKNSRRGWDTGMDQDQMVPWVKKEKQADGTMQEKVYERYYHLYREGELQSDTIEAGGRVVESGYEKDNWWAIVERVQNTKD